MNHPFHVGGTYRNRNGEYEVVTIMEPNMTVRQQDGRILTAKIATLASIWENIQAEAAAPPLLSDREERQRMKTQPPRAKAPSMRFAGLKETDFKPSVTGTSWRAGDQLGGLLAKGLTDELGVAFKSWPVYRQARVYLTYEEVDASTRELGTRVVKFYFLLDEDGARCGLYIERSDQSMDETWDWQRFVQRLGTGEALETVFDGMQRLGVQAEERLFESKKEVVGRSLHAADGQLKWRAADGQASVVSWREFARCLEDVQPGVWTDLYFYASIPKAEALALGVEIADRAVQVFRALYPLYRLACK